MRKGDFSDLAVFIAVAEEGSFTRAAAKLGLSQSALSYAVRMFMTLIHTSFMRFNHTNFMPWTQTKIPPR